MPGVSGFHYPGDGNRPEGYYNIRGEFYGDNGKSTEMDVMLDNVRRRATGMISVWSELASGLHNPRAKKGVLGGACEHATACTNRLRRVGG